MPVFPAALAVVAVLSPTTVAQAIKETYIEFTLPVTHPAMA
jgi:hypothetical protein